MLNHRAKIPFALKLRRPIRLSRKETLMAKLVVLITPRLDEAHDIADAWQRAGAPGVTFIESYGLGRMKQAKGNVEVLPGMMSMLDILRSREQTSVTLLSIINEDDLADRMIDAAQNIIGDLNIPNNGLMIVIDIERVVGLLPFKP